MHSLHDYLIVIGSYASKVAILFLIAQLLSLFKIPALQKRIIYGITIFVLFSVLYIVRQLWLNWLHYTTETEEYTLYGVGIIWWLSIAFMFSNMLHYFVWQGVLVKDGIATAPKLMQDFIDTVIYACAVMCVIYFIFGQPITGLLATSSVVAVILGLGAQRTLGGIIAGLSLSLSNSFHKGDTIVIDGIRGEIIDMNWRSVTLLTSYNNHLVIPNSKMADSSIVNYSKPLRLRLQEMTVFVPYEISPQRAKDLLHLAMRHSVLVLQQPAPEALLVGFEEGAVRYTLHVYTSHPEEACVKNEVLSAIWYIFNREGIRLQPVKLSEAHNRALYERQVSSHHREQMMQALKNTAVFKPLMDHEIEEMASKAKRLLFGPPECVVVQGDSGSSLFFVERGRLEVCILQPDGNHLKLAELSEGAIFGEMALLTGEARSATVIASTDVVVYEIRKEDLMPILNRRKEIVDEMSKLLARRQLEIEVKSAEHNELMRSRELAMDNMENKFKQLMRNFFNERI